MPDIPEVFLLSLEAVDERIRLTLLRHRVREVWVQADAPPERLADAASALGLKLKLVSPSPLAEAPPPRTLLVVAEKNAEAISIQLDGLDVPIVPVR